MPSGEGGRLEREGPVTQGGVHLGALAEEGACGGVGQEGILESGEVFRGKGAVEVVVDGFVEIEFGSVHGLLCCSSLVMQVWRMVRRRWRIL